MESIILKPILKGWKGREKSQRGILICTTEQQTYGFTLKERKINAKQKQKISTHQMVQILQQQKQFF